MENVRNRIKIELMMDGEILKKRVAKTTFKHSQIIREDLAPWVFCIKSIKETNVYLSLSAITSTLVINQDCCLQIQTRYYATLLNI